MPLLLQLSSLTFTFYSLKKGLLAMRKLHAMARRPHGGVAGAKLT